MSYGGAQSSSSARFNSLGSRRARDLRSAVPHRLHLAVVPQCIYHTSLQACAADAGSVVLPESERNPGCMKSSKPRVGRTRKRTANSPAAPDLSKATLKIPPILLEG